MKLKIFNSCVVPVLTYGCESWRTSPAMEKKLDAFENKCLRRLLNICWHDFRSVTSIRQETQQDYVSNFIRRRRWNFIGHVLRMDEKRLPQQAFTWSPGGKRKRGRPKDTLRRVITRECSTMLIRNTEELKQVARNRQTWRAFSSTLCAAFGPRGATN